MKNESKSEVLYGPSDLYTTVEFAAAIKQAPATVRKNLSIQGHHHGAKPTKLTNGRLLWKAADALKILNGEAIR